MFPATSIFVKGLLLTQLASLGGASFFLLYKTASAGISPLLAAFGVFTFALMFSIAPSARHARRMPSRAALRSPRVIALIIALAACALVGNWGIAISLQTLPPSSAHLLQRSETLFTILIGICFFRESGGRLLLIASVFLCGGIWALSRSAPPSIAVQVGALPYVMGIVSAISFACMQTFTRMLLDYFNAHLVNALRLSVLVIGMSVLYPPLVRDLVTMPTTPLLLLAAAAFVGPFIGRVSYMNAGYAIGIGRAALFASVSPVYTMILQYLFLDIIATPLQLLGSLLLLIAVSLPIITHMARLRR